MGRNDESGPAPVTRVRTLNMSDYCESPVSSGKLRIVGSGVKVRKHFSKGPDGKKDPVYCAHQHMWSRCTNPKYHGYHNYGGRGITVCERWRSVLNFMEDMRPSWSKGMSLDRIDNSKGYSPENCRWATMKSQQRNRRHHATMELNGVSLCLSEWSERTGIPRYVIEYRVRRGWKPEDIVSILPRVLKKWD